MPSAPGTHWATGRPRNSPQQPDEFPNIGALLTRAMNPVSEGGGGYKNAAEVQKALGVKKLSDIQQVVRIPWGGVGKTDGGE